MLRYMSRKSARAEALTMIDDIRKSLASVNNPLVRNTLESDIRYLEQVVKSYGG